LCFFGSWRNHCLTKVMMISTCVSYLEFHHFRSMIYFEWIFMFDWYRGSNIILLYEDIQLLQYRLWKILFFHWIVFLCQKPLSLDSGFYSIDLWHHTALITKVWNWQRVL
jgi:hypothetical protein